MVIPCITRADLVDVTILHTNDFHGCFDRAGAVIHTIRDLREQFPHSLLLDAGDAFEGKSPKAALTQGEAIVEFMNRAGYDAMTFGDNEFDGFTLGDLQRCMERFSFPVVNANLVVQQTGRPLALPYFIFTRNGATIAVIGLYGEESLANAGILKADPLPVARFYISLLKDKVDCIVLLTHQGFINDRAMARTIEGVDVIIGGSSHKAIEPKEEKGVVIAQAGSEGQTVGVLELKIDTESNHIQSWTGRLVSTIVE